MDPPHLVAFTEKRWSGTASTFLLVAGVGPAGTGASGSSGNWTDWRRGSWVASLAFVASRTMNDPARLTSHSRISPSADPEARTHSLPVTHASAMIASRWPASACVTAPERGSHSRTLGSDVPHARRLCALDEDDREGGTAMAYTLDPGKSKVATRWSALVSHTAAVSSKEAVKKTPVSTGYHATEETPKACPGARSVPSPLPRRNTGSCVARRVAASTRVGCSTSYAATTASTVPASKYRRSVWSSASAFTPPAQRCANVLSPLSVAASPRRRETREANAPGRERPSSRRESSRREGNHAPPEGIAPTRGARPSEDPL